MVALTDDGPMVYGVCAVCTCGLPEPRQPSRPRTVCDAEACLSAARAFGTAKGAARRRRFAAERRAQTTRRKCSACPPGTPAKPLDLSHFTPDKRLPSGEVIYSRWCRECKRRKQAERRAADQPGERVREKRALARRAERMAADPEYAEHRRKAWRESARRVRAKNPAPYREAQRRYLARVNADPERKLARLERDRMARRLKRERDGLPMNTRTRLEGQRDEAPMRYVPAKPLGEAVDRMIRRELAQVEVAGMAADGPAPADSFSATRESLALGYGTTDRTLRAWLSGERQSVAMADADRVMVAADLLPFDVWTDPAVLALWSGP